MRTKRILITRLGGFGDDLIATPLIRFFARLGQQVEVLTQEPQGSIIFAHNPHIQQLRFHVRDSVKSDVLLRYLEDYRAKEGFDDAVQLNESLEVRLALHPEDPAYSWSKPERIARCNRNYYEECFRMAAEQLRDHKLRRTVERAMREEDPVTLYRPEMFFTPEEHDSLSAFRADRLQTGATILWALAGSATHKTYPYADYVMLDLLETNPELVIVTVGGPECELLERGSRHPRLKRMANGWSFRQAALVAREYCEVVVAPDTGILHAAGGGQAATVGLFGHCTIEQSTKHFPHDYSLEAQVDCAPCMRLVYDIRVQCPVDPVTTGAWCMSQGLSHERVRDHIGRALAVSLVPR